MGRLRLVCAILLLASCMEPRVQHCASGRICPAGTRCDDEADRCVSDEQLLACEPLAEGDPCTIGGADGFCENGACIPTRCGDGRVTGIEDCEPGLPITIDCVDRGYYEPAGLACRSDCTFDETQCLGWCGDHTRNGPEVCEDDDLGGSTCETFGYYAPDGIVCNPASCTFDLSGCTGRCGDLVIDIAEGESCDGAPPASGSCVDYGFDAGSLRCSPFCTPGFAACGHLGWHSESTGAETFSGRSVWASSLDDIYIVGNNGRVVHGHHAAWVVEPLGYNIAAAWGFGNDIFVVGGAGTIMRRDPSNGEWGQMSADTSADLLGVWGTAPNDVWAVGDVIDHFDGSWSSTALPIGAGRLHGVYGTSSDDVWAVGEGGTILHWDGLAWASVASPTTVELDDVWASGTADAWAVGDDLLHWDGVEWSVVPGMAAAGPFHAIAGAGRDDVLVFGYFGTLLHWDGRAWSTDPYSVSGAEDSFLVDGVLVTAGGGLEIHFRESSTWLPTTDVAPPIGSAQSFSPDDVWAIAFDGTVYHWDGLAWSPVLVGTGARNLWGSGPTDLWVAADAGTLWRFDGLAWTSTSFGAAVLGPLWGAGPDDVWMIASDATWHWDGSTWSPDGPAGFYQKMWGAGPDDIWAIGRFGALRHFDGTQWSNYPANLAYEFIWDLWGTTSDDVWAVASAGQLYHYDGTTWSFVGLFALGNALLAGTAPDDVFVIGSGGEGRHFDGTAWAPMRPQTDVIVDAVWGERATLVIAGRRDSDATPVITRLDRHTRWACRTAEIACGDAIDDDCDGAVDGDDADCRGAVVLDEIHGGADDYIEVRNRTSSTMTLDGLVVVWSNGCSSKAHELRPGAIVRPGEAFRVVHDRTPGAREVWSEPLCDEPDDGGWVALCAGRCDLVSCSNVLDFVAMTGTSAPAGIPACAGMVPSIPSVTGATAAQSLGRVGYAGSGPKGMTSDWAIVAATRD